MVLDGVPGLKRGGGLWFSVVGMPGSMDRLGSWGPLGARGRGLLRGGALVANFPSPFVLGELHFNKNTT